MVVWTLEIQYIYKSLYEKFKTSQGLFDIKKMYLNVENHVLNIQYFTETGHFTVEKYPLLYADDILGVNKVFRLYFYCIFSFIFFQIFEL